MTVKVEIDDRLATDTINRPEVRNALSRQVLADLRVVWARDVADGEVKVFAVERGVDGEYP